MFVKRSNLPHAQKFFDFLCDKHYFANLSWKGNYFVFSETDFLINLHCKKFAFQFASYLSKKVTFWQVRFSWKTSSRETSFSWRLLPRRCQTFQGDCFTRNQILGKTTSRDKSFLSRSLRQNPASRESFSEYPLSKKYLFQVNFFLEDQISKMFIAREANFSRGPFPENPDSWDVNLQARPHSEKSVSKKKKKLSENPASQDSNFSDRPQSQFLEILMPQEESLSEKPVFRDSNNLSSIANTFLITELSTKTNSRK